MGRKMINHTRTLQIFTVWFTIHLDDNGNIDILEEHDHRVGGAIDIPTNISPEKYFVERVQSRVIGSAFKKEVARAAKALLTLDVEQLSRKENGSWETFPDRHVLKFPLDKNVGRL
jgi:hypothetical protein